MPGPMKVFKKGEVIFTEGSKGNTFYFIEKGSVEASCIIAGKKTVVDHLSKGQIFGEYALLRGAKNTRSATIKVLEDTLLIEIDRAYLRKMLKDVPPYILASLKSLVTKLIKMEKAYFKLQKQYQDLHLSLLAEIIFKQEESFLRNFPRYLKKYPPKQRKEMLGYLESMVKACRKK